MNTVRDAVVIASAGAAGLAFFGWPVLRAWRARLWPAVDGTIVESRVEKRGTTEIDYHVCVRYRYTVIGQEHHGERMTYFSGFMGHKTQDLAARHLALLAPGTVVTVHYDPKNPAEAVVETAVPSMNYVAAAFSTLFLLGGLLPLLRKAL